MAFESLANETLIDIVKYAGIDGTTSSWLSLASCNQTLNRIATPMLYLAFTETSRTSVPKLLRTVQANPQLATYVRRYTGYGISNGPSQEQRELYTMLKQHGSQQNNFMAQALQQKLTRSHGAVEGEFLEVSELRDADFAACREAMKIIGAESEVINNWMSRIRKGKWHALTSLLLLHLPNLEEIDMRDYRHDEAGEMERALGIAAHLQGSGTTTQFSLEHLTDVSLSAFTPPEDDEPLDFRSELEPEYLYFTDVMPFLKLPSVQSVAISRLSDNDSGDSQAAFPHCNFSTKDLEITDSCLDMWWLGRFLRIFTSLRRFSYNHVAMEQEEDFLPQEIGKAIAHLRPCLEELEISDLCEQNGKYTTPEEIGSLAGFERLRSVEVDGPTLFGFPNNEDESMPVLRLCDILPRALERLVLSPSDSPCHEEHLRGLLEVKEDFKAKGVKLLL